MYIVHRLTKDTIIYQSYIQTKEHALAMTTGDTVDIDCMVWIPYQAVQSNV